METDNIKTAIEAGKNLSPIQVPPQRDGIPFIVIPEGSSLKSLKELIPNLPARKRGNVEVFEFDGFARYFNEHKSADSRIFGGIGSEGASFKGILDFHGKEPAWQEHTVTLKTVHSHEWKLWIGSNGKAMDQTTFAQFVEDNLPDFLKPAGAAMLEIALNLTATKSVTFESAKKMENGNQRFLYQETTDAKCAKGSFEIPEAFSINIPVFQGNAFTQVDARFRYRLSGGTIALWYELVRPHKIIEEACETLKGMIEARCETTPFIGTVK